jgi:adenylate kinase family enzyme
MLGAPDEKRLGDWDRVSSGGRLPRRIVVSGDTGSGKTTLARRLAGLTGAPHIELDALFHGPNWTPADDETFRSLVLERTAGGAWVIDGNYRAVRDLTWGRADLVVWLDYPIWRTGWRLFWRTLRRRARREELWNGNRESLRTHFLTKDSLFLWLLQSHGRHRRTFPAEWAQMPHLRVVRIKSPTALKRWLASVAP